MYHIYSVDKQLDAMCYFRGNVLSHLTRCCRLIHCCWLLQSAVYDGFYAVSAVQKLLYLVAHKRSKPTFFMCIHNLVKYWPIFIIFSPATSVVNLISLN